MEEMTPDEAATNLAAGRLGILSLARGGRAYAFPLFYAYTGEAIYFHSHPGDKDGFIEATEEACLTYVRAETEDDWVSVQAYGHVRRIGDVLHEEKAMEALMAFPPPPELGSTESGEPRRSMKDATHWMMEPTRITGRKSRKPSPGGHIEQEGM